MNRHKPLSAIILAFIIISLLSSSACNEKAREPTQQSKITPRKATLDFLNLIVNKKDYKTAYKKYADKIDSYKEFFRLMRNMFDDIKSYKIIKEKSSKDVPLSQFDVKLTNNEYQSYLISVRTGCYVGNECQVEASLKGER